jgi:CBS domain-containing protein
MPQLKDILHNRKLFSVQPDQTVAAVAAHMAAVNVGAIPVIENKELRGVFSERDLMKRVVLGGRDPQRTLVGDVMSTTLTKADEQTTSEEAMELMRRCGCRHLPVMRSSEVVGFISMRDLMIDELEQKAEEIRHMRNYIQSV